VAVDNLGTVYIADRDGVRIVRDGFLSTLSPTHQMGLILDLSVSTAVTEQDAVFNPVVFVSAERSMLWFRTRAEGPQFADLYPTALRGFVAAGTDVSVQVGTGDGGQILLASDSTLPDTLVAGRPGATGKEAASCVLNDEGGAPSACLRTAGPMVFDSRRLRPPDPRAGDLAFDLYVCDIGNHRVRKIAFNGVITTVAGGRGTQSPDAATSGFSGDGGAATLARLSQPSGVAIDEDGNFYISDAGNLRVRRVEASGVISTIAGNGGAGAGGDGGPALDATFCSLGGLAVDSEGNVYVADTCNYKVRLLRPMRSGSSS